MDIIIFGLFLLVYFDAKYLKKQNQSLYAKTLRLSETTWSILCFSFIALIFILASAGQILKFGEENSILVSLLFLLIILSTYLLRRREFKRRLKESYVSDPGTPKVTRTNLISDALGVVLLSFFWAVAMEFLIRVSKGTIPLMEDELWKAVMITGIYLFVMLFLIVRTTERYRLQIKDEIGQSEREAPQETNENTSKGFAHFVALKRFGQPIWKVIFVPMAFGTFLATLFSLILLWRPTQPDTPLNEIIQSATSPLSILILIGMAVIIAPLFEEIIFRGYFYRVIKVVKGSTFAVGSITLLFGLLHVGQYAGDWLAIGMVFLVGFVLTILRYWTGSAIAGIVMHYVFNGGMVILPIIFLLSTNPAYFRYQMKYELLNNQEKEILLLESIEKHPKFFVDAYNDLAWLYVKEDKNLDKALELIEHALSVNPDNQVFLDTKAEVLFKLGRLWEAIAIEEELVEKYPEDKFFQEQLEKFKQGTVKND